MEVSAFHHGQHIDEAGLQPPAAACPLCGSTDRSPMFEVQTEPVVTLLRCHSCGGSSVSRMPTRATRDEFYGHYYDDNEIGVTADDPARLARRIASYAYASGAPAAVAGSLRIIDFGGGNGAVSRAVADLAPPTARSIEVVVVDYDPDNLLPGGGRLTMTSSADLPPVTGTEPFDIVIAGAVLEHLPEPMKELEHLLSITAADGLLYARTPYVAPLIATTRKVGLDIDFTFPAHLHDMGQPFWDAITTTCASASGFDLVASRPSPVETGSGQPARTAVAAAMKAPWRVLGHRWPFVGGWEVALRSTPARPVHRSPSSATGE
jgi:SAM-dependent methyltransferase